MARWSVSSLRARLIALVLLAVVPAWGLIFYDAWVERREEADRARDEAVRLSRLSAAQFQGVFETTGRLLMVLAQFDAVRRGDAAGCNALLTKLLSQYPEYVNLGVAWPNGDVFCIAPPFTGRLNVGDRPSFGVALETRELTIGELQASRTTGKPVLVLRYPVVDPAGRVRMVVNAVMDLARLNMLAAEVGLPSGAALLLLSSDGRLVARYPDPEQWIERATSDPAVAQAILANRVQGAAQAVGVDGVLRLYGFTPLSAPRQAEGLYASVGIPVQLAFAQANRNLVRNLAWLGLVTLLALAAAWGGGRVFVLSPVRALVRATERLAAGDLGARTGLGEGRGELSQLARAFDNMAGTIERHLGERQRAEARLARLNDCLLSFGPDPRENINRLVACCGEQLGAACALYNRLDEGKLCAWGQWNVPADFNPVDTPSGHICFDVIRGDRTEPWVICNLPQTAYAHTDPNVLRYGLRTYAGKAVAFGDTFVGSLCVLYREDRVPSDEEIKLLGIVASAIGVEEERKQAEETLAERTQQLEAVRTVSEEITRELDLTTVLDLITRRAVELVRASSAVLRLWQEETGLLVPQSRIGVAEPRGTGTLSLRLGEGVAGAVAQGRQGLVVNDFRHSPYPTPAILARTTHTAVLAEPLLYRDRLVGVINLNREEPGQPFTEEDRQLLALLAAQAAIAIENARLYADLKQAYEELRRTQDGLVRAEKLRALGEMAAGIAHDLNNVLAAVLAHVELLRLQVRDPKAQERLAMVETAAADGSQIVRRLQGFARQQPTGPLVPCNLAALVQEVVEITRPRWRDESQRRGAMIAIGVALSATGELPPILGQPAEIRQALTNLILNAVDAMPVGGTLTLAGNATADEVILTVADTGVGMSEEVRRQVFDPFFTTKGGQGSGLGLSVVYAIMQRHGGHIDVASSPGTGATFTLRFRAAPDVLPPEGEAPPRPGPRRRILLIDDNPAVCQTVASLLRTAGHTVMEAHSGAAGLAILAESPVDVVFTDLGMSDVNGWDVARVVKGRDPRVPVILLTGWGEQPIGDAGESASEALVDRVIGKPFRLRDLLAAIAELTGSAPKGGREVPSGTQGG